MLKNMYIRILLFIIVLGLTFILRAHNYERVPGPGHLDEQLYAWSGIHLIETGVPVSWSTLNYPDRALVFEGVKNLDGGEPSAGVKLYKPWLDEPPLFSLLVGSFAHYFGADRNDFIPSSYIRFPVIFLSTVTSILVFLLAKKIAGYWMGIFSMLIYGTVPLFVIASRVAMPENLISLLFIATVYLLHLFKEEPKMKYLIPIPLFVGIAGLSKPTGFFILPFALFVTFQKLISDGKTTKNALKPTLLLTVTTLPFIVGFFVYGNYFDPEIFKIITSIQSSRPVGFNSLTWLFISPSYGTTEFRDAWYVFSLLSGAFFIFKDKSSKINLIVFAFVYWFCIVMISGGENDLLAWYRFPTFPYLAILAALGIKYLFKKADFFASFIVVGMLLGNRMLLVNAFRPNVTPMFFRISLLFLLLPSLLFILYKTRLLEKLSRVVIVIAIMVGMYINIRYIYNAFELECESKTCAIVPSTSLSRIHYPFIWRFLVYEGL